MSHQEEALNVVTETQFKSLIEAGYRAEVVCTEDAYRRASIWYGVWIVRVIHEDGTEKVLVTTRHNAEQKGIFTRTFRTTNGLISFLDNMGFEQVNIPLKKERRIQQVYPKKISR